MVYTHTLFENFFWALLPRHPCASLTHTPLHLKNESLVRRIGPFQITLVTSGGWHRHSPDTRARIRHTLHTRNTHSTRRKDTQSARSTEKTNKRRRRKVPAAGFEPDATHRRSGVLPLEYDLYFTKKKRRSAHCQRAAYILHTLLYLSNTRYALTDTRRVYKRALHNTNAHSAARANTHSARKTEKQTGGGARKVPDPGFEPGSPRRLPALLAARPHHLRVIPCRLRTWPPHGKTQGNVGKTQYKNLWAAPPPLAEVDYTRMLDDTHARMRVHTHTRHKLTIQTRLYTTNNSKQGLNSIHTLPMVPNTTKLKQNSTTTTEHNRTSRSSTQTNTSALTKALKRSKKQERFKQQKPNNKELENTKTKP